MLTECAQPTSLASRPTRALLSAASSARIIIVAAALLVSLYAPMPSHAGAQSSTQAAGAGGAWPWPLLGEVITPFANVPNRYAAGQHRGLDIAAPTGASVLAIVDGRVSYSSQLPDGGQAVTVTSDDGRWLISNLHLSSRIVRRGELVRAGQRLGRVGTSGRRSADAPHLHLSVRSASPRRYVDPMTLLGKPRLATERMPAASPARVRTPKITSLERPARSAAVRAQPRGDASPATRHGAEDRQTTHARSAGASTREGHAARGKSRVAPPPLKAIATSTRPAQAFRPAQISRPAQAETAAAAAPDPASAKSLEPTSGESRRRPLLLAVAFVCIAALLMRRSPQRERDPAPPEPHASPAAGEIVELDEWRASA